MHIFVLVRILHGYFIFFLFGKKKLESVKFLLGVHLCSCMLPLTFES